jgi:hypothetical protein
MRADYSISFIPIIRIYSGAGLVIGVLEDNDDNDDTASGNCGWVLSIRDKPNCVV